MSFRTQAKVFFQFYPLILKDYYTDEAPLRLLDVASHFFPFADPYCVRILEFMKGKQIELVSDKTLQEEDWANLKRTIQSIKKTFGIEEEIVIAKDLTDRIADYAISGNMIIVNDKRAFAITPDGQKFAIAHELSHYIHRDLEKRTYMNLTWIVIDVSLIGLAYYRSRYYILALVVAELGIFHLDRAICRRQEKNADLKAVKMLGTNQGAKEGLTIDLIFEGIHFIKMHPSRFPSFSTVKEITANACALGLMIHSSIFFKFALTHPTHIERLRYCCVDLDNPADKAIQSANSGN